MAGFYRHPANISKPLPCDTKLLFLLWSLKSVTGLLKILFCVFESYGEVVLIDVHSVCKFWFAIAEIYFYLFEFHSSLKSDPPISK